MELHEDKIFWLMHFPILVTCLLNNVCIGVVKRSYIIIPGTSERFSVTSISGSAKGLGKNVRYIEGSLYQTPPLN